MIGGVVAHHHFIQKLLQERYTQKIEIIESPQNVISLGAALIAKNQYIKNQKSFEEKSALNTI
jgi:activator of 2-hydroxyglutaryl-CoA dehydratase